jgi:hypothetical protein
MTKNTHSKEKENCNESEFFSKQELAKLEKKKRKKRNNLHHYLSFIKNYINIEF